MKRFTETSKWENPWFRALAPKHKALWSYLCDRCDNAGVINPDWPLMSFCIGETVSASDLAYFGDRIEDHGGKLFLVGFLGFQYGTLSENCKPHIRVLELLEKHGLSDRVSKGYPKGIDTLEEQDKEKEEEKDKEEDREKEPETEKERDPLEIRFGKLFNRRPTTRFSESEQRAWKTARPILAECTEAEWKEMEAWYAIPKEQVPYRKTDPASLLRSWHAELEKSRRTPTNGNAPDAEALALGLRQRNAF